MNIINIYAATSMAAVYVLTFWYLFTCSFTGMRGFYAFLLSVEVLLTGRWDARKTGFPDWTRDPGTLVVKHGFY